MADDGLSLPRKPVMKPSQGSVFADSTDAAVRAYVASERRAFRRSMHASALVAFAAALATGAAGFLVNDIGHFTGFMLGAAAAVVAGCIFLYKAASSSAHGG